jgi:hypothetical protein
MAFTALLFSCSKDAMDDELLPVTRAQLSIGLEDKSEVERQEEKFLPVYCVHNASGAGSVASKQECARNTNIRLYSASAATATDITAKNLEVVPNNDIMVIVIANEPQSLTSKLNTVTSPWLLQSVDYDIANILDSDGEIVSTTGMPMTGVIRDISVASDEVKAVKMVVERAVARVDIFLEATDGGAVTGYTKDVTSVTLHNSTHKSYFVMGNEANYTRDNANPSKNYGKVMTNAVDGDLLTQTWTAATTETWAYSSVAGAENRKILCSFYVAERIFRSDSSDQLAISMVNVLKGPPSVTGIAEKVIKTITKVDNSGTPTAQPFTEIRRNNVYQITARVGKIGIQIITISVEGWGKVQDIDLDMYL